MFVSFKSARYTEQDYIELTLDDSSHPNNVESTFGFHTQKTVPTRNRDVTKLSETHDGYFKRRIPASDKEKAEQIAIAKFKESQHYATSPDALFFNAAQIMGYIPVLSLIPCGARLLHPLLSNDSSMHLEPKEIKMAHYIRGGIEGLGLGIIYLIPDLIITVKRFCMDSDTASERLLQN